MVADERAQARRTGCVETAECTVRHMGCIFVLLMTNDATANRTASTSFGFRGTVDLLRDRFALKCGTICGTINFYNPSLDLSISNAPVRPAQTEAERGYGHVSATSAAASEQYEA